MEQWRSAERVQERRLWSTLTTVGTMLSLTLLSSLLLTGAVSDGPPPLSFYLQQAALLILSLAGTVLAVRRGRAARAGEVEHSSLSECDKAG